MKRMNIILPVLILIAAGISLYFYQNPSVKKVAQTKTKTQLQREEAKSIKQEENENTARPTITSHEISTVRESFPDMFEVSKEVKQDPHRVPSSLIQFAHRLGPLMTKALKNDQDANILVNVLHDCALDMSVAIAARALCVSDSDKLGGAHPGLKEKTDEIRTTASPDVISLLNKEKKLMKK